jgi:hypothetical protein
LLHQEYLRALDPPNHVVAMGRFPEGLLECSAEVMGAQSREPGKRRNRYVRGKVLLDMGRPNRRQSRLHELIGGPLTKG